MFFCSRWRCSIAVAAVALALKSEGSGWISSDRRRCGSTLEGVMVLTIMQSLTEQIQTEERSALRSGFLKF